MTAVWESDLRLGELERMVNEIEVCAVERRLPSCGTFYGAKTRAGDLAWDIGMPRKVWNRTYLKRILTAEIFYHKTPR